MKFIKTLLAVLLTITLVGCTNNKTNNTAFKIGGSGPLSGGASQYGEAVFNGAKLAVEEINALGGIQFELNFLDDQHDPEQAVATYNILKDWGMQMSIHTTTSAPGAEVSPLYCDDHIFGLTPSGSSYSVILRDINDPNSYFGNIFQMCFTDPAQGTLAAKYIKDNNLANNVAVIYKNDDPYSKGIYEKFDAEAKASGINIVYVGTFDNSNASDFSVTVNASKEAGADLVFLPIYFEPASLVLKQASTIGYDPIFFGVDGMDGILTLENFDTTLAEGVYLLTPFDANSTEERIANFVKNYTEKFGISPNQFAADAYDCIYSIYNVLKDKDVSYDIAASELCDILVEGFKTTTFDGITGVSSWNVDGTVNKDPKAVVIENGVYVSAK